MINRKQCDGGIQKNVGVLNSILKRSNLIGLLLNCIFFSSLESKKHNNLPISLSKLLLKTVLWSNEVNINPDNVFVNTLSA